MMTRTLALRSALSLTQEAFGHLLGVSHDTVGRLERGKPERRIHAVALDKIARDNGLHHLTSESFTLGLSSLGPGAPASPVAPEARGEALSSGGSA